MKVLLVNGSPHKEGCTYTALTEVEKSLNKEGIETDIFWIGNKPISGCIACKACVKLKKCVFNNDKVNEFIEIAKDYDGFIFGTPVHWAAASGAITSFLDRVFYADSCGGRKSFYLIKNLFYYLMKLVNTVGSTSGNLIPAFIPASLHFKKNAIFFPNVLIICIPSKSCFTSSGFAP